MRPRPLAAFLLLALAGRGDPAGAAGLRAFVTSVARDGNLVGWPEANLPTPPIDGLDAGDHICRTLAGNAGLANANKFRAWLSDSNTDAYCHIFGLSGTVGTSCNGTLSIFSRRGPWQRIDGLPFAQSAGALATGAVLSPLRIDESHHVVSDAAWTGTDSSGVLISGYTCNDWTSHQMGDDGFGGGTDLEIRWTESTIDSCDTSHHLYCLDGSSGIGAVLVPWERAGALVFVTSASGDADLADWPLAGGVGGLAGADAVCQVSAAAASLPEPDSFVAFLGTSVVMASGRVPGLRPFKRLDGMQIAADQADFLDGDLAVAIVQDETGAYIDSLSGPAFTGANPAGNITSYTCGDWTWSTGGAFGAVWSPDSVVVGPGNQLTVCDLPGRLICMSRQIVLGWDSFESGGVHRWSAHQP